MQRGYGHKWNSQREHVVFDNNNFPPLKPPQEIKLEEMSHAILSMQHCLEKLMQHNFPDKNQVIDNANTHGMSNRTYATAARNNMYTTTPQFTQEAKNATNPQFLQ